MLLALGRLGVGCEAAETGSDTSLGPAGAIAAARRAPGTALVAHVHPPFLPLALRSLRPRHTGGRVVGYWAWELPVAPADWRFAARSLHEIWTPSAFSAQALEPLLPGRVRIVPHPLALAAAAAAPLGRTEFGLPDNAVVVLVSCSLASSIERKNPHGGIAAFRAAFGARSDRLLLIKLTDDGHDPAALAMVRAATGGMANVRLETRILSDAADRALIAASDIVLSLHRSEGFGLVMADAMLLGRAVVATGWSGNLQFMDAASAALVGYRLVPARDARAIYAIPEARWAEPDIDDAVAQLRRLADDPMAREALGLRAREAAAVRLSGRELIAELLTHRDSAA